MQKHLWRFFLLILILTGVLVACDVDSKTETVPISGIATLPNEPDPDLPLVGINAANAGAVQLLGVIQVQPMTAVAFNPVNSDQLAASDDSGTIRIFQLSNREMVTTLEGHTTAVHSILYNSDGTTLITADDDGNIRLWNVDDGTQITNYEDNDEAIQVLGLGPFENQLAFSGQDQMVHVSALPTGDELAALSERASTIRSLAFNPLGTLLAAGARDGTIQVFRLRSKSLYYTYTHDSAVTALTFYSDGQTLISGDFSGVVRAWDTANQTSFKINGDDLILDGPNSAVRSLAFSADQSVLAVGHEDGSIVLWDFEHGVQLNRDVIVSSTAADVNLLSVKFLQSDQIVAAVTESGQIWMWGPEPGAFPTETPTATNSPTATVTFTPTNTLEPTDTLMPSETPENTDTPQASDTPDIETTPSLQPSETTTAGPTVTLNATPVPTATRTVSPTPTPLSSPTPTTPPCSVTPLFDNARVRALPDVNSGQVGRILLGESAAVDSQTLGSAGEVWWHIVDPDGWVRFDIVQADESCENVPLIELDG